MGKSVTPEQVSLTLKCPRISLYHCRELRMGLGICGGAAGALAWDVLATLGLPSKGIERAGAAPIMTLVLAAALWIISRRTALNSPRLPGNPPQRFVEAAWSNLDSSSSLLGGLRIKQGLVFLHCGPGEAGSRLLGCLVHPPLTWGGLGGAQERRVPGGMSGQAEFDFYAVKNGSCVSQWRRRGGIRREAMLHSWDICPNKARSFFPPLL